MRRSRLTIAMLGAAIGAFLMTVFIVSVRAEQPSRVLSIGGDVTEILYALGQQDRIIAVDATSQFPAAALRDKLNVGYMRALSTEGVLSVGPQLIIAADRAGPPDVIKALKASLPFFEIAEGTSAEGVPSKIRAIAEAAGVKMAGEVLADRVASDLSALAQDRATLGQPLRALFVLNVQNGRATVGGSNTSADAILQLAGLQNAAASISGFKPVGDESLIGMNPDIVVTMQRTAGGHDTSAILGLPGLSASPAAKQQRIVVMDGLLLLGFGPRVAEAARDLMRAAYPLSGVTKAGALR